LRHETECLQQWAEFKVLAMKIKALGKKGRQTNVNHGYRFTSLAASVKLLVATCAASSAGMLATLVPATSLSLLPFPAHATNGQCKWEGGPGAPTDSECVLEDCMGNGGNAQCVPPVITTEVPGAAVDSQGFAYTVTTANEYDAGDFCIAEGGTWNGFYGNPQCTVSYSPPTDSAAVALANAFIAVKFPGGATLTSDSGWGATSGLWWYNGPTGFYADGNTILIESQRNLEYTPTGSTTPYLVGLLKTRGAACPATYATRTNIQGTWDCWKAPPCCKPTSTVGDPVALAYGELQENEVDYDPGVPGIPTITRYFRSGSLYRPPGSGPALPAFSDYWRWTWQRTLYPLSLTGVSAAVQREDGGVVFFNTAGQEILNRDGAAEVLTAVSGGGWTVKRANSDVETYNAAGQLTQYQTVSGIVTTLTYSANSTAIVDSFGHKITYNFNSNGQLVSATLPSGSSIQYGYNPAGQLTSVTNADLTVKQYVYQSASNNSWLLAGITDESGNPYASFTYQAGVVSAQSLAGGVASWSFDPAVTPNSGGYTLVTDPLNNVRQYNFVNASGVMKDQGVSNCPSCGLPDNSTYDGNGNLQSEVDFNGNTTSYAFDETRNLELSRAEGLANGQPTAATRTTKTQWHPTFRLPAEITVYAGATATGTAQKQTAYQYDSYGNVLTRTVTDPASATSRTWTYTYYNAGLYGQVKTVVGPRTDVKDITTYTYYNCATGGQCGQVATVTDALSHTTTYNTYNADGLPLTIKDQNGVVTTLTYDLRQHLKTKTKGTEETQYNYYPTGLLQQIIRPDGSYLIYTYDGAHRLTQLQDSSGASIVYTLDNAGNRQVEQHFNSAGALTWTHSHLYNQYGELWQDLTSTNESSQATQFGYDPQGNQNAINAPLGRNTTSSYDQLNRLTQITDPAEGVTQIGFDALDDTVSVTDPRELVTGYTYNGLGDLLKIQSPDTGTTQRSYDSGGNPHVVTDARQQTATYTWDALNRVAGIGYSDQTITYTYDQGTNGVGRLSNVTDQSGSTSFGYDTLGRVNAKTEVVGGISLTVTYTYVNNQLTAMKTPSGQAISYSYNGNNQIAGISINGTTLLAAATYLPFGPVTGWTWGNGTQTSRSYDLDGRVIQISSAGNSTYTYFDDGSISSRSDDWASTYDLAAGATSVSVSPSSNEVTSTTGVLARAYKYDNAGNETTVGGITATYGGSGRMTMGALGSAQATYLVNASGQRVSKASSSGTTLFAYDEWGHLLGEYTSSGALIEETVWFGDIPVATLRPNGTSGVSIYYVHTDQLNTPRRVTAPVGNVVIWRWDSDPFGVALADEDPDGNGQLFVYNLRFPGQYYDSETGLNYNMAREYDPATGRYVESDPIGLYGGSLSTYTYANNNPLSNVDPAGLQAVPLPVPAPIIIPPVAVPGTPENKAFVDAAMGAIEEIQAAARRAARAIENACSSKTKEQNCRALYDTIIRSCWSITDPKKRQRCFEAAKSSYEECMSQD